MHLKSLKVFCDVVGRRSFSKAARSNGMTQSGASQIVHHLEVYLGVKLIDRSKRPFVLTPEGQAYYDGCRHLVQSLYALEEEIRTLHLEVEGRVTVASIYSVGLSHMNASVRAFLEDHPRANVRVEYQHPDQVYTYVENGQVDLGLTSYPKPNRSIKVIPWRDEPMVIACAPSHRFAGGREVGLKDLAGLEMVVFDERLQIRREIDRILASREIEVQRVMEFDNIETLKRAVEIDAGFSLLPEPTVLREVELGTLVTVPLADVTMVRPLGIIHRCNADLGATARRFVQFLLDSPAGDPSAQSVHRASSEARTTGGPVMAAGS